MTSLAVADTIVAAAQGRDIQTAQTRRESTWSLATSLESIRWTRADVATIVMMVLAGLLSRLGLFHIHMARRIWLLVVLVVIGLWSGNLISMALVAGWSAEGVAWRLAPGLSAIAAVTFLFPPLTKSNPYCNHLCPHGAVQQLIKPGSRSRRRWRLSGSTMKWLQEDSRRDVGRRLLVPDRDADDRSVIVGTVSRLSVPDRRLGFVRVGDGELSRWQP